MARLTSLLIAFLAATVAAGPYPGPACTECVSSPNNCDITAPCAHFINGILYCGCRPGYKATTEYLLDTDPSQWRIQSQPGHEHRVWVAPGVVCDSLCDEPWGPNVCGEIPFNDACPPVPY